MVTCATCGGRGHRRASGGWERCPDCLARTIGATYIHAAIRATDAEPGEVTRALLPLTGFWAASGDFRVFRALVWRSLLAHEPTQRVTYDVLDAYRVLDISFQRDAEGGYTSVGDVAALPLLVLLVLGGPGNPYTGAMLQKLVEWRQMHARPTWVYVALDPKGLRSFLGPEAPMLLDVLLRAELLSGSKKDLRADTTSAHVDPPVRSRVARPRPAT